MIVVSRCDWVKEGIHQKYHDTEWGIPLHNDKKLFEFLLLDGAQAGLSWFTILKRRPAYRKAFDNFNPEKISQYKKFIRKRNRSWACKIKFRKNDEK